MFGAFIWANIAIFFPKESAIPPPQEQETPPPIAPPKAPQQSSLPPVQPLPDKPSEETMAYVINELSNDVWLMNLDSGSAIKRIPVGNAPAGGFLDGSMLYVSNAKDDTISVINTSSNRVTATIPTDKSPHGIAVVGDDIFVANNGDWTVTAINKHSQEKKEVGSVKKPTKMVYDARRNAIYVTSTFSNEIYFINPSIRKITKKIEVGTTPDGIAISHDSLYMVSANKDSNDISLVVMKILKEKKRIQKIGITPRHAAFTPDDRYILVANMDSADIAVISMFTEELLQKIELEGAPTYIITKGAKAYVTGYNTNAIYVIDAQNLKVAKTIHTGLGPIAILPRESL